MGVLFEASKFTTAIVTTGSHRPTMTGDLTYIKVGQQWQYLAVIFDVYSRKISHIESFFHSLKAERIHGEIFKNDRELRRSPNTSLSNSMRLQNLVVGVMDNHMSTFKKLKRVRRQMKFMGFVFLLVGGLLCINSIVMLLNPESTLSCNGVVTNSVSCKVQFTAFAGTFFVVGVAFLLAPRRWLNRLVVWQSAMPSLFGGRRK